MRDILIKQINTYAMMHSELRKNNINDTMYYREMIKCINKLKQLDNVVTLSDYRDNNKEYNKAA